MGFMGGGSGSASNTLSNIINFSPSIQTGEANKSDLSSAFDQRASSEAQAKDQQSTSAGVSGSGSATGGTSSLSDVMAPNKSSVMNGASNAVLKNGSANTPDYAKYGLILAGGVGLVYIVKQLKK